MGILRVRRLARPIGYVTAATVANQFVGFLGQILAARLLGAGDFGTLSLGISVLIVIVAFGELGINLSTVRLFNKYAQLEDAGGVLLGSVLVIKGVIACGLVVAGVVVSFSSWGPVYALGAATAGLVLLWTFFQTLLQCYRQYETMARYIALYSALRVGCLVATYAAASRHPVAWLLALYTLPTGAVLGVGLVPRVGRLISAAMAAPKKARGLLRELVKYTSWVALASSAYVAMPYLLRFIVVHKASLEEVGVFSAGMAFTMALGTVNGALRAVLFPEVTAFRGDSEVRTYLGGLARGVRYFAPVAAVGIGALAIAQPWILGPGYGGAVPVFMVTAIGLTLVAYLGLATIVVHTMMKPHLDAWVNVGRVLGMILMAWSLVPRFGALGAGFAYVVPLFLGEVWLLRRVRRHYRRG